MVSSLKLQSEGNAGGGNLLKQSNNWVKNPPQNNLPIRDLNSNNNNNDKDIEVIKYLNHNSNDDKGMIKNKVYKFFMTKRNSLSQSKVVKSKMEYETQLRKKLNFIQEVSKIFCINKSHMINLTHFNLVLK